MKMILTIDTSKFEHDKEMSMYNSNYYNLKKVESGNDSLFKDTTILEEYKEGSEHCEFYLIPTIGKPIFLGCSNDSFNDTIIEIDFRFYYA